MSRLCTKHQQEIKEHFRLRFQCSLREHLARHGGAGDGFVTVWQKTLAQVRLEEPEQAEMYWELFHWASRYELFTGAGANVPPPTPS